MWSPQQPISCRLKPFPKPVFTALASLNFSVEQRVQGDLAQCTRPHFVPVWRRLIWFPRRGHNGPALGSLHRDIPRGAVCPHRAFLPVSSQGKGYWSECALEVGFRLEGTIGHRSPWLCRGHCEELSISLRRQCPLPDGLPCPQTGDGPHGFLRPLSLRKDRIPTL